MSLYYETALASIFHGNMLDCIRLPRVSKRWDLCITSPPYGLDVQYGRMYDDGMPYARYMTWMWEWALALRAHAKPTSRIALNIPLDTNKGGKRAVYADYVERFRRAGWNYQTTIIWNEQNISRRTAWGSWRKPSAPFVTAPVEMIVLFYAERWQSPDKGKSWEISAEDFMNWTLGHWTIPGAKKKEAGGHPAPFPEELPRRLIKLYSYDQDVILDPFLGSGTTCKVALDLGRASIGIESEQRWCQVASDRMIRAEAARDLGLAGMPSVNSGGTTWSQSPLPDQPSPGSPSGSVIATI